MDTRTLADRLEALRAKRGYLLPHHGLMAISGERLLDAYDATYTELTLEPRVLTRLEHESVWLAILIHCEEALATHHIPKYFEAGGSLASLRDIQSLTAFAAGADGYAFVERHWLPHLEGLEPRADYLHGFDRARGDIPAPLAQLCGASIMTCQGQWAALAWHIEAAYRAGAAEAGLAEALSLAMFPGSVPHFVQAAGVWRELIINGRVEASADFRAWAELTGQGGYDEAAGVADR